MSDAPFTFRTFGASEVEMATGISQVTQRNWRRGGYFPSAPGRHVKLSVQELCSATVLKHLTDWGLPPSRSKEIADTAAPSVFWHALEIRDCWDVRGPTAAVKAYRDLLERSDYEREYERVVGIKRSDLQLYYLLTPSGAMRGLPDPTKGIEEDPEELNIILKAELIGQRLARLIGWLVRVDVK